MTDQEYKGNISFINYEKQFATIEYQHNNKIKSVNFKTDEASGKKSHQFMLGDGVSFQLKLSDRGDKMTAFQVQFTYNTAIDLLIQQAAIENRFSGYLKIVGEKYFVKEWENYILFPLQLSPWEKPPVETAANEAISFRLLNLDKPRSIVAELFSHNFIPEYKMALQHFNHKIDIPAVVYKLSPHAVYLNLFGEKIKSKLPLSDFEKEEVKEGDPVQVVITHFSNTRIVVKRAAAK
ncbi:MAG: hypothetical protein ABIR30_07195 [Chitinophagaceae bacterium]